MSIKTAVLIFVHKNSSQVIMLCDQLIKELVDCDIFIHLDKKANNLVPDFLNREHIHLIKNNVAVTWGDDSMVNALENSISEICSARVPYSHFIICTGQDLMVRRGLKNFLETNSSSIFIDMRTHNDELKNRLLHAYPRFMCAYFGKKINLKHILRFFYDKLIKMHLIPKKRIKMDIDNIVFYHSFNWSVMPFEVIQYVNDYIHANQEFMKIFRNTYLPEDGFLGTIIMNSKYKNCVVMNQNSEFVSLTFRPPLVNHHNPLITPNYINEIESNEYAFFARKFDLDVCPEPVNYFFQKIMRVK